MAASLVQYHRATNDDPELERDPAFSTEAFQVQLTQMLGRFQLHRDRHLYLDPWPEEPNPTRPLYGVDKYITHQQILGVPLAASLESVLKRGGDHPLLMPWDSQSIPFRLHERSKPLGSP
jgi:hypothetical protein